VKYTKIIIWSLMILWINGSFSVYTYISYIIHQSNHTWSVFYVMRSIKKTNCYCLWNESRVLKLREQYCLCVFQVDSRVKSRNSFKIYFIRVGSFQFIMYKISNNNNNMSMCVCNRSTHENYCLWFIDKRIL